MSTARGLREELGHDPDTTPAPRPAVLAVLLFCSTLTVMAGTLLVPVLGVMREDLAIDSTSAGLVLTAHGLSIAVAGPFAGRLMDRFGLRGPLVCGLLLYAVAGGAGLVTTSFTALLISRFLFGAGAAAVFTGTTVALLTLYRGSGRDRIVGWRSTAISLGGIAWPLLGGALGALSWHSPFAVYLVGLPAGIAVLILLPRTPPSSRGTARAPGGTRALLRSPRLLRLYAVSLIGSLLLYVLAVFVPQRLTELGVERPLLVALYTMTTSLSGSVVGLCYAKARARLGYTVLLRTAAAAWALALLVAATAGQAVPLLAAPALFGAGMGISVPALTVLIGENAPPGSRARATSLSGSAAFTGQFLSPLLFGPLAAAASIRTAFLVAVALAATVPFVLTQRRLGNE
ncbi:MFS transporter [Streptomyces anulatus]|uniref:MFS transporter n=1 Tax=Streptomyces anulatus TaxID=1892 RepID=UPI00363A08FA